jgi:hypothetical protein
MSESEAGSSQSYLVGVAGRKNLFSRASGDQGTKNMTPTRRSTTGLIKRDIPLRDNGFRRDCRFVVDRFVFIKNDYLSPYSDH